MKSFQSNWIYATNVADFAFYSRLKQEKQRLEFKFKRFALFTWSIFFLVILISYIPRPSFPKPKPRLFFWDKIFRNRDFFSETEFSETETLEKWQKFWNRKVMVTSIVKHLGVVTYDSDAKQLYINGHQHNLSHPGGAWNSKVGISKQN